MRALPDANLLASSLLPSAHPQGTIKRIVRAGLTGAFTLLLPDALVVELLAAIAKSRYLASQITPEARNEFVAALREAAEELPPLVDPPAPISRDPNDDYLLAHALAGRADYLVTGDKDLLALADRSFPFQIVTPAQFLTVLEEAGLA